LGVGDGGELGSVGVGLEGGDGGRSLEAGPGGQAHHLGMLYQVVEQPPHIAGEVVGGERHVLSEGPDVVSTASKSWSLLPK
jgi:hypothetical protein